MNSDYDADVCSCEVRIFVHQNISPEDAGHLAAWLREQADVVDAYQASARLIHYQMHLQREVEHV